MRPHFPHPASSLFRPIPRDTTLRDSNLVLHRSPCLSDVATWNDDGDNSSYTLTEAPTPLPSATKLPDSSCIKLVYEAGDACAIWRIGNEVCCKARYLRKGSTPESTTINFVRDQKPGFETPKVLRHAFFSDRSFLFVQCIPGRSLNVAWPSLDKYWRLHCTKAVAKAVMEMAEWEGHTFGDVDDQDIPVNALTNWC